MSLTDAVEALEEPGVSREIKTRDAERTKQDILEVAIAEFANSGLSGARVNMIADKTQTTKRMIYYYFGSKEGLYQAALERAYGGVRQIESDLDVDNLDPETAIRRLVEFSFDYHFANPNFIRLVMIENIHKAEHVHGSLELRLRNSPATTTLARLLARGIKAGVFKRQVEPVDLHLMISALCFYRVSNQYTFGWLYDCDLADPRMRERQRRMAADAVAAYLLTTG